MCTSPIRGWDFDETCGKILKFQNPTVVEVLEAVGRKINQRFFPRITARAMGGPAKPVSLKPDFFFAPRF